MRNAWAVSVVVLKEMYRRKDFYVLFFLTVAITLAAGSVQFFHEKHIVRYVEDICLLLIWISGLVIAIATTARQIPAEIENRTIFPLLAKPIARWEVIVGKFLGCWFATGLALVVFYLFFGLVTGSREGAWPLGQYFQALWLQWQMLGIVIGMVLLGSMLFSAPSSNATICFLIAGGIFLLGRHLNRMALSLSQPWQTILYSVYYAIPHLELFDVRALIVHGWPLIPWGIWLLATGYALVYIALLLTASCWIFRRKPLN